MVSREKLQLQNRCTLSSAFSVNVQAYFFRKTEDITLSMATALCSLLASEVCSNTLQKSLKLLRFDSLIGLLYTASVFLFLGQPPVVILASSLFHQGTSLNDLAVLDERLTLD